VTDDDDGGDDALGRGRVDVTVVDGHSAST